MSRVNIQLHYQERAMSAEDKQSIKETLCRVVAQTLTTPETGGRIDPKEVEFVEMIQIESRDHDLEIVVEAESTPARLQFKKDAELWIRAELRGWVARHSSLKARFQLDFGKTWIEVS